MAALTLLAACGAGADGAGDGSVTATTGRATDQERAERVNLRLADFPPEWRMTPVPPETAAAAEANGRTVAECLGRPPPEDIRDAIARSPDFSAAETRRATSSVAVMRTVEVAEADFAALRSDRGPPCHQAQVLAEFRRQRPEAAPPVVKTEPVDVPRLGDDTVAFRTTAAFAGEGAAVRTVIDEVFVRKGRTVIAAAFVNAGSAFPAALEQTLLQRMADRA